MVLLVFIYLGYPAVVFIAAKRYRKTLRKPVSNNQVTEYEPTVSIIIPAFNEASVIKDTILNKVAQNYDKSKIEIIVVSDESTDDTDAIVEALIDQVEVRLSLIKQIPRQGKTAGVNTAVTQANGEILVFSDANSMYQPDTLKQLVQTFEQPEIGYVTGQLMYQTVTENGVSLGCSSYMQYENFLRQHETEMGSVVGVDGGVDAMRKALFTTLSADQLPDFVQPLCVVEQGYRVVYQPEAVMLENALSDANKEFKMRVRVSLRALWALWDKKSLFNPTKFGLFSFQLIGHKLLRYLAFVPQVSAIISNLLLIGHGLIYECLLVGQILFYALALLGFYLTKKEKKLPKLVYLSYYLNLLNVACCMAFLQFVRGNKIVVWKPREG